MKILKYILCSLLIATPVLADGTIDTLSAGGTITGTESMPMFQTGNPAVNTTPNALDTYLSQTTKALTNKTINCANNTCTVRIGTDVSGLGTGIATFLATPTSANLAAAITNETGSGALVFGTAPSIAGGALSGTFSGNPTFSGVPVFTGIAAGTIAAGKNLGLDSSNNLVTATVAGGSGLTVGSSAITSGTDGRLFYDNAGVLGEAIVGSGLSLSAGTLSASGGSAAGVGVQAGQSPSNIGDNTTALPSGHYYYATNVAMTAQRTHNLPDSAAQGAGDLEVFDAKQTATATNQLCVAAAGTDKVNTVTNGTVCITTAGGSIYLHNDGAGEYTTGAATNIPAPTNAQLIVGKTGSPSNTLAAVTMSQDCTITNAGVVTCTKTNNVSFSALATTTPGTGIATALGVNVGSAGAPVLFNGAGGTPSSLTLTSATGLPVSTGISGLGTGVATAAAVNLSANGGLTKTVFSGAKALATGAISSAACTSAQTDTATGTLTTDVVLASFNGDPTAVTGYVPLTAGMLTIMAYPTADTVNFKVCNNTSGSITPGAITLNWRVVR